MKPVFGWMDFGPLACTNDISLESSQIFEKMPNCSVELHEGHQSQNNDYAGSGEERSIEDWFLAMPCDSLLTQTESAKIYDELQKKEGDQQQ